MTNAVFTIGHSTHPVGEFIDFLRRNRVTAVADVRSSPYSRFNPQFNRESLKAALAGAGIQYVFMGVELGARSTDRECYIDGRADYDLLAKMPKFQQGIERISQGAENHVIALMCAEKDPLTCHRAILVARHLSTRNIAIQHILEDGSLESNDDAISRLLIETGSPDNDLFRNREELVDEAFRRRGLEIAYTERASESEQQSHGANP